MGIRHTEGIAKKTEFGLLARTCRDRQDIEAEAYVMKAVPDEVGFSGSHNAPLLGGSRGVLGRIGILPCLDLDENKFVVLPGNDVDFTSFRSVAGGDDAKSGRAEIIDSPDLGPSSVAEQAME
jgi:hypothetical protein